MVEIESVTKRYGDFTAVNNISITAKQGEVFSFLGVNGAGKTTTLRMLVGILKPTSGAVRICGHDVAKSPVAAKRVTGYIPDRPHLYEGLTGVEYLKFVAELYDVKPKEFNPKIEELLEDYTLTQWRNDLLESYSHGMKQRLATCAALVTNPKVLVVDEPMVGLDPHGAKMLKQSFRKYAEQGMTIFLSTHSLNVAEEVSDRLSLIHHGEILAIGTLAELRERAGSSDSNLEQIFIQLTSEETNTVKN